MTDSKKLGRLLATEEAFTESVKNTPAAKRLAGARVRLLEHIREIGRSGDLANIVATERTIVEGDLARYSNSQSMGSSLKTALNEIRAIERHLAVVDDKAKEGLHNPVPSNFASYESTACEHRVAEN